MLLGQAERHNRSSRRMRDQEMLAELLQCRNKEFAGQCEQLGNGQLWLARSLLQVTKIKQSRAHVFDIRPRHFAL